MGYLCRGVSLSEEALWTETGGAGGGGSFTGDSEGYDK
jgi:hypothetical protein